MDSSPVSTRDEDTTHTPATTIEETTPSSVTTVAITVMSLIFISIMTGIIIGMVLIWYRKKATHSGHPKDNLTYSIPQPTPYSTTECGINVIPAPDVGEQSTGKHNVVHDLGCNKVHHNDEETEIQHEVSSCLPNTTADSSTATGNLNITSSLSYYCKLSVSKDPVHKDSLNTMSQLSMKGADGDSSAYDSIPTKSQAGYSTLKRPLQFSNPRPTVGSHDSPIAHSQPSQQHSSSLDSPERTKKSYEQIQNRDDLQLNLPQQTTGQLKPSHVQPLNVTTGSQSCEQGQNYEKVQRYEQVQSYEKVQRYEHAQVYEKVHRYEQLQRYEKVQRYESIQHNDLDMQHSMTIISQL